MDGQNIVIFIFYRYFTIATKLNYFTSFLLKFWIKLIKPKNIKKIINNSCNLTKNITIM
jgi:hypothetical protein